MWKLIRLSCVVVGVSFLYGCELADVGSSAVNVIGGIAEEGARQGFSMTPLAWAMLAVGVISREISEKLKIVKGGKAIVKGTVDSTKYVTHGVLKILDRTTTDATKAVGDMIKKK